MGLKIFNCVKEIRAVVIICINTHNLLDFSRSFFCVLVMLTSPLMSPSINGSPRPAMEKSNMSKVIDRNNYGLFVLAISICYLGLLRFKFILSSSCK